jgi:hypothetical protein
MTKASEPEYVIGRHDWRVDGCVICGLQRRILFSNDKDTYTYSVNDRWIDVCTPCVPRLLKAFPGFFNKKAICKELGIVSATFVNRQQMRRIHPAAVGPNQTYLWRQDQFHLFEDR